MKTISIITIIGIVVIYATSVGIFIGKVNDYQQQSYLTMTVNGLKENYTINDPISFSVILEGYGTGCGDTTASITKENDSSFQARDGQACHNAYQTQDCITLISIQYL